MNRGEVLTDVETYVDDQQVQVLTFCPTYEQQTTSEQWKHTEIPGGQGSWWHCSMCHGWHVLIVNVDSSNVSHL